MARIAATGGDTSKIRFTFQEYFRRMSEDPSRWSQPFAALLGAYEAQMRFGLPSIGGKDSMSGTFQDIDVPPTLVSFAVDIADANTIISPELKKKGSKLVVVKIPRDAYDLPDFEEAKKQYGLFYEDIKAGRILSAYALDANGLVGAVSQMAFGNGLGVKLEHNVSPDDLFAPDFGSIVAEVADGRVGELGVTYTLVGEVTGSDVLEWSWISIPVKEAFEAWSTPLEGVFKTVSGSEDGPTGWFVSGKAPEQESPDNKEASENRDAAKTQNGSQAEQGCLDTEGIYRVGEVTAPDGSVRPNVYVCKHKVARPRVFIPVFPGTNCEYDSAKAFERAGADVDVKVFRNLTAQDIRDSVQIFEQSIDQAQIIMFPGGFSAGDEPDGSAKFFATAFRNERIKEAVERLLGERDGLALGICNGFQALIKLGLVPNGTITGQDENAPTLTFNTIGRHVSKMVYTKVMTNKSPWLALAQPGKTYVAPASHGEGRFVASPEWIAKLVRNGQVATMYADCDGALSMDENWNVNGSYAGIEGITSPDGRVLGKMCHVERRGDHVAINITGEQDMKLFEAGVRYFR